MYGYVEYRWLFVNMLYFMKVAGSFPVLAFGEEFDALTVGGLTLHFYF